MGTLKFNSSLLALSVFAAFRTFTPRSSAIISSALGRFGLAGSPLRHSGLADAKEISFLCCGHTLPLQGIEDAFRRPGLLQLAVEELHCVVIEQLLASSLSMYLWFWVDWSYSNTTDMGFHLDSPDLPPKGWFSNTVSLRTEKGGMRMRPSLRRTLRHKEILAARGESVPLPTGESAKLGKKEE